MKNKDNNFPFKSILVVCSVNTARSPMAEGFLRDYFSKMNVNVKVISGGIASNARDGMLISLDARLVMKEIGIELSSEATSIDLKKHSEYFKDADLILTLTEAHKLDVLKYIDSNKASVMTIKEFGGSKGDIADPSMKGIDGFRKARDEIKKYLIKGLNKFSK